MKNKNNDSILNLTLRLVIITVCAGLILGLVYAITKDPIEAQQKLQAETARKQVLAAATEFVPVDLAALNVDEETYGIINEVYEGTANGEPVGYTFEMTTKGYSAGLSLTVGLLMDGTVSGMSIGSHSETPGLGANATKPEFLDQFVGGKQFAVVKGGQAAADSGAGATIVADEAVSQIDALTGATITSNAVKNAVNLATGFYYQYLAEGV